MNSQLIYGLYVESSINGLGQYGILKYEICGVMNIV